MDVRSIEDVEPVIEHNGTVPVWWLVNPREMFDITKGGHLELVSEFEVAGGGLVDPHEHPTHEFYYVTSGRGIMNIAEEFTGYSRDRALATTARIEATMAHVFTMAKEWGVAPGRAAERLARERIAEESVPGGRWSPGDPTAWTNGKPLTHLRPRA